eukprot:6601261-Heterocapsa_arctica.AAC.1
MPIFKELLQERRADLVLGLNNLDMKSGQVHHFSTALDVEEALKPLALKAPGGSSGEESPANQ